VCDLETSRIGAPYIYDISSLRVNILFCDSTNMRTWVNDTVTGGINSNVMHLDQCVQCYVLIYLYVCHPDVSDNQH